MCRTESALHQWVKVLLATFQNHDANIHNRKHYRVIFKDVCRTVGDLKYLGEVMDVLGQTLIPPQLMTCAGWVHRDISSGNILARKIDNRWVAKVGDLEYAKKFPPPPGTQPSGDPKTGTPFFMALEILDRRYIFQPRAFNASDKEDDDKDEFFTALHPVKKKDPQNTERFPTPPVVHNFQHDVESVWWITLWTLTGRVDHVEAKNYANAVFQTTLTPSSSRRQVLLSTETTFQTVLESVLPPSLSSFVPWMVLLRRRLLQHYDRHTQNHDLFVKGSYGRFHTAFQTGFSPDILEAIGSGWQSMELAIQNPYLKASVANKSRITVNDMYPGRKRPQTKSDDKYKDSSRKNSKTSGHRMQTCASAASASASGNS